MPREWHFGALSVAWPNACATDDTPRVADALVDAFVDRTPIDWAAVFARSGSARSRALCENVRALDAIRGSASPAPAAPPAQPRLIPLAGAVVVLSALQTGAFLAAAAIGLMNGTVIPRGPQLALAGAFTAACVLLGLAATSDRRSAYLLATYASAASAFARAAVATSPPDGLLFHGLFPEAFAPATLWQFALEFPRVRRFSRFDVIARRAAAASWFLALALFTANLALDYGLLGKAAAMLHRNDPRNAFWHLFAIAAAPAVCAIVIRSRRAPATERRKVTRFAAAIAAGAAPFLLCGLARLAIPAVDRWFLAAGAASRFWSDGTVMGGLIALPMLTTAAVVIDLPFDVRFGRFVPGLARVVRAGVTIVCAVPLVLLLAGLYRQRRASTVGDLSTRLLLAYATAGTLLAIARPWLIAVVERALRRSTDHRERLAAALERVRLSRGQREVYEVLRRELCDALAAPVRILVAAGDGSFADARRDATRLGADTALAAVLAGTTDPVDFSDGSWECLLPRGDREWLVANRVELAAAMKRRDGSLAALIVAGRKGEDGFDARDRWLIKSLASAASARGEAGRAEDGAVPSGGEATDEPAFECRRCGAVATSALVCACDGDPAVAAVPPRLAGKFVAVRRIGAGGMGVVYLARDVILDRPVALKTLPELRDGAVAPLRAEARAMAALNHESLATIYGLELWRRTPVLVVEYLPDGTLADRLRAGPLSAAQTLDLGIRLGRALVYMHGRGVLHLDLKPSNVGFTSSGSPKLLDFGLATLIGSESTEDFVADSRGRIIAGTRAYLPPEALRAAPGPSFDLWSLSAVLVECLTGRAPLGDAVRAAADRAGSPLGRVLRRALATDPSRRFLTAVELLAALERAGAATRA